MAINKVVYGNNTLIDLSTDTLSLASQLLIGIKAHDKTGKIITGTLDPSGGGGGLPTGISKLDFGNVVVSADFTTSRQTFNHKLGVVPDLVIVFATANVATTYSMLIAMRGNVFGYRSSAYNNHMAYHGNSTTTVTWTNSNSTTYGVSNMTATTFQLASSSSSYYWRKGTYKYLAIKFS